MDPGTLIVSAVAAGQGGDRTGGQGWLCWSQGIACAQVWAAPGSGRTVETAFELGKSQLDLHNLAAADQPQLLGKADPAQVRLVEVED